MSFIYPNLPRVVLTLGVNAAVGGGEEHVASGFEDDGGAACVLVVFGEHEAVVGGGGEGDGFFAGGVDQGDAVAAFGDESLDVVVGELGAVRFARLMEARCWGLVNAVPGGADDVGALRVAFFEGDHDIAHFGKEEHATARAGVGVEGAAQGALVAGLQVVLHTDAALLNLYP